MPNEVISDPELRDTNKRYAHMLQIVIFKTKSSLFFRFLR